jgi:aryl-alcohol dehydrogenase-like predicted oxidoreductase
MRQRTFGTTDLATSEIAFGTWALGSNWWGETDDPDRLISRALELGITFFDTGDAYAQGRNEELVGRALAGADRDSI